MCFGELERRPRFVTEVYALFAGANIDVIRDLPAIDGDRRAVARPHNADGEQDIELRYRPRGNGDAGLEGRQLQITSSVQRQVLDAGMLDDALDVMGVIVDL